MPRPRIPAPRRAPTRRLAAALTALLAAVSAHAQDTTLVSIIGQADRPQAAVAGSTTPRAQRFTTGSHASGYTLEEIVVNVHTAGGTPVVALYTSNSSNEPGTKVVDLNGSTGSAGRRSFTPASATTLSASTSYFVRLAAPTVADAINLRTTFSNDLDPGAAPGWDVGDNALFSTNGGTTWTSTFNYSVEIAVKGEAVAGALVSNVGQTDVAGALSAGGSVHQAQRFTTGSHTHGYVLSQVSVDVHTAGGTADFDIYTSTAAGLPGRKVVDLSGSTGSAGPQSFTPASDTTLAPSTDYFVYFRASSGAVQLRGTNSDDLDAGAAAGWDIADESIFSTNSGGDWSPSSTGTSFNIAVVGAEATDIRNPPEVVSSVIDGRTVTVTYNEPLDESSVPAASAFFVGHARRGSLNAASVSVVGRTVTLTVAVAAVEGDSNPISMSYQSPTTNPIRDPAGNNAASFPRHRGVLTNITDNPDFLTATVEGGPSFSQLELLYDEPLDETAVPGSGAFTVKSTPAGGTERTLAFHTTTPVRVSDRTVTLLVDSVAATDAVTVSYAVPSSNSIRDLPGADAAALTAEPAFNVTGDTTRPALLRARITPDGLRLELVYDDVLDEASVPPADRFSVRVRGAAWDLADGTPVSVRGRRVTLALARTVGVGHAVRVSYTPPPVAQSDRAPIQDRAGNDAPPLSNEEVRRRSSDVTGPVLATAAVDRATLTLTYDTSLDATSVPAAADFAVKVTSGGVESERALASANPVALSGARATLTLASPVEFGDAVTLDYAVPTGLLGNPLQDVWENAAAALDGQVVTNNTPSNFAPEFPSATATRTVAENTAANTAIGAAFAATDADGDTLAYSLAGADAASFAIDASSGQLRTSAPLDFETKPSHAVTVRASDGTDAGTVAVTVNVTDVDEKPAKPAAPTVAATADAAGSLDVSWTAPGRNGGPAIAGYVVQYRQGASGSWSGHPHADASTATTIGSLAEDAPHQVRIRALNGETPSDFSDPGSATTLAPGEPSAPRNLVARGRGSTTIDLTWDAPASDGLAEIAGYRIQWSATGVSGWADLVADTGNANRTHADTGLSLGTTRHYRVAAINAEGTGPWSNTASYTTTAQPSVVLALASPSVNESGAGNSTTLTASLDEATAAAFTLTVTAAPAGTVTLSRTTIDFAANATAGTQTVTVTAVNDGAIEADPVATISGTHTEGRYRGPADVRLTVRNDDFATVGFTAAAVRHAEGAGALEVCVGTSAASPFAIDVAWATEDGTAKAGRDFTAGSGTLRFPANDTDDKCVDVAVVDETEVEDDETFAVALSGIGAREAAAGTTRLVATITDTDRATATLAGPVSVSEGAGTATFSVALVPTVALFDATVLYSTRAGTAAGGDDYTEVSGQVTFPKTDAFDARGVRREFTVPILDDGDLEGPETFDVAITRGVGLNARVDLAGSPHRVTIADDEVAAIVLSTRALEVPEGGSAQYTVRLGSRPNATVTVAVDSADASEVTASPASLTFTTSTWDAAQTVTLAAPEDDGDYRSEVVQVTHTASGGGYGGVVATLAATARDNDRAPGNAVFASSPEYGWSYGPDESVIVDVTYDDVVAFSGGTPRLMLVVDGENRAAELVGGEGTPTLRFSYVVTRDDFDYDGVGTGRLEPNGATVAGQPIGDPEPPLVDVDGQAVGAAVWTSSLRPASIREGGAATFSLRIANNVVFDVDWKVDLLARFHGDTVDWDDFTIDGVRVRDEDGLSLNPGRGVLPAGASSHSWEVEALVNDDGDATSERLTLAAMARSQRPGDGERILHSAGGRQRLTITEAGSSAAVSAAVRGDVVELVYDGPLDGSARPASGDFAVEAGGAPLAVAAVRVAADRVLLRLDRPPPPGARLEASHPAPGAHPLRGPDGIVTAPAYRIPVRAAGPRDEPADGAGSEPPEPPAPPYAPSDAFLARQLAGVADAGLRDALAGALARSGTGLAGLRALRADGRGIADLAGLEGAAGLRELDLSDNAVADLGPLAGLPRLRRLHLAGNAVADLGPLAGLAGLRRLDLAGNRVADLAPLAGLAGLETLLLAGNAVADAGPLLHAARLVRLDLGGNPIAELGALAELPALRRLDLGGAPAADVSPLGDVAALVWLDLSGRPLADAAPLSRLARLRWLFADDPAGLAWLADPGRVPRLAVRAADTADGADAATAP